MKNRLLCVMLCTAAVLFTLVTAEAKNKADDRHDAFAAASVMSRLGVIEKNDNNSFDFDVKMTRAEFASVVVRLLNIEKTWTGNVYFSDVGKNHRNAAAVGVLVERGSVSVSDDNMFYPEQIITCAEACKILLSEIGYGVYAETGSGYPLNYITVASRLKIIGNINDYSALDTGEAYEMIYNAFNVDMYIPKSYNETLGVKYYTDSEKTVFSIYRNIKRVSGVLYAVNGESTSEQYKADIGRAMIDNELFTLPADYNIECFLGEKIIFVYEDNIDKTILYAEADTDTESITVNSSEIGQYDKNTMEIAYTKDKTLKEKHIYIPSDIKVILNGRPGLYDIEGIFENFINGRTAGTVCINMETNCLIINSWYSSVVTDVNNYELVIRDYPVIDLNKWDNIKVYNSSGELTDISKIQTGNAVSIAEGKNNELIKIIISTEVKEGMLTGISVSDKLLYIDGEEYKYAMTDDSDISGTYALSGIYRFITDAFERVVGCEIINYEKWSTGYLIDVGFSREHNSGAALKIYDDKGNMQILYMAETVKIDGEKISSGSCGLTALSKLPDVTGIYDLNNEANQANEPKIKKQVIRFQLNSEGNIRTIDSYNVGASEDSDNSLTRRRKTIDLLYTFQISSKSLYRFGTEILYSVNDSLLFNTPYTDDDGYLFCGDSRYQDMLMYAVDGNGKRIKETDDMYKINGYTFMTGYFYDVEEYNYNGNNLYADVLVLKNPVYRAVDAPMMVCKIYQAVLDGENGVNGNAIDVLQDGMRVTYKIDSSVDLSTLKVGDIIRAYVSDDNLIAVFGKVFDNGSLTMVNRDDANFYAAPNSYTGRPNAWFGGYHREDLKTEYYHIGWQLSCGKVTEKKGTVVRWKYGETVSQDCDYNEAYDFKNISTFMIYDKSLRKNNAYIGTISDVNDYKSYGNECSTIILHSRSGLVRSVFVIK